MMSSSHASRRSFQMGLKLLPIAAGLAATSFLFGYANSDGQSQPARRAPSSTVQMARSDSSAATVETTAEGQTQDPLNNYKATLDLLKKNYYGVPVDAKKSRQLTYEAIRGMLFSLRDQFTSFLDPDEWSQMQATTQGDFEGIGALLQEEGSHVKIVRPIETGPAEALGIKADDIITAVDGFAVKGQSVNDVVRRIKGKNGTKVRLSVLRGTTPLDFTITRALVEPPVVKHWMEDSDSKIGHIVLTEFNEKSIEQMNRAFADLDAKGMKALVFDLRYNPGGLLETAVQVASVFIPPDENDALKNVVVYIHEGSGNEKGLRLRPMEYTVKKMPIVVLVNGSSASASEIVSGAIKDYGIATLMGERTFGKGRVQTLYPQDDGSALRLTTALYYPPKHYDINFERDEDGMRKENTGGILPDIEVKQSSKWRPEDFKDKVNDTQLQSALNFLRARLNGKTLAQARDQIQTAR